MVVLVLMLYMYFTDPIKYCLNQLHAALMNDEQRNTTHKVFMYGILLVKKNSFFRYTFFGSWIILIFYQRK